MKSMEYTPPPPTLTFGQPKCGDTQSSNIVDGVVSGEHGGRDQGKEFFVTLIEGLGTGRDVERGDGQDGRR